MLYEVITGLTSPTVRGGGVGAGFLAQAAQAAHDEVIGVEVEAERVVLVEQVGLLVV